MHFNATAESNPKYVEEIKRGNKTKASLERQPSCDTNTQGPMYDRRDKKRKVIKYSADKINYFAHNDALLTF